ncbi:peroxiredoxin-like family protein [Novosphingobium sp.]|uniref:peroxiredoxin-like family protein n=1 Tax=Novosphingobium sp. TaxID=1874826 RepID=UPI0025F825BE|nr:peroxiredoxin-like family protein [Novosphingobium sp.]
MPLSLGWQRLGTEGPEWAGSIGQSAGSVPDSPDDLVTRLIRRPMALKERLEAVARDARERCPDNMALIDGFVARLEAAQAGQGAPAAGEMFPPFMLPDHEGRLADLAQLHRDRPLVIVFHRGHWCPYCRVTLASIAEAQVQLASARIVAISAEMQRYTRRIRAETQCHFRFLSDMDAEFARSAGLAVTFDPAIQQLYLRLGKRIPDFLGSRGWTLAIPAVFVLDRQGIVRARHIDPDFRRRMEIDALIKAVAGLGSVG